MHVVMVGFHFSFARELDALLPPGGLTVVEEPDVHRKKELAARQSALRCLREVVLVPYQQRADVLDAVAAVHRRHPVDAVVPGLEYGVVAAADIAARLGRPGAGPAAARALRDKLTLRDRTTAAGLAAPRYAEVTGPAGVSDFLAAASGEVVLKPADRQASLGVQVLDRRSDVSSAWAATVAADEGTQLAERPMAWRYLVEERLRGPEVSVEALVRSGRRLFTNVTAKATAPGRYPVELGHVLPAALDPAVRDRLGTELDRLVDAIGFDTGILHAEWILTPAGPTLVECAGRVPGDKIVDLLGLAYGRNFFHLAVELLARTAEPPPAAAARAAAVRFLHAAPGRVEEVTGAAALAAAPGVVETDLYVAVGDLVEPLRSSWQRLGHAVCVGADAPEADRRARAALDRVRVVTGPG